MPPEPTPELPAEEFFAIDPTNGHVWVPLRHDVTGGSMLASDGGDMPTVMAELEVVQLQGEETRQEYLAMDAGTALSLGVQLIDVARKVLGH